MSTFLKSEQGTDLVEYTLILAFLVLSGAAMFIGMGSTTTALWSAMNNRLASSNQGS